MGDSKFSRGVPVRTGRFIGRPLSWRQIREFRTKKGTRAHKLVKGIGSLAMRHRASRSRRQIIFMRSYMALTALLFTVSVLAATVQPFLDQRPYEISPAARQILPKQNERFGKLLTLDPKTGEYAYNKGYTGGNSENGLDATGVPRFGATFNRDPVKGLTVTDNQSQIDFTLKPKFQLGEGKQEANQMFYKLRKQTGYLVYTARISGVKEDIVLESSTKDKLVYEYEIDMVSSMEARLELNGSIGVYGSDLPLNGQVSTGSDNDAKLLEKVRENSEKNKLLFNIPAPVVVESNKTVSDVKVRFELDGKRIKLIAEGLKQANYPLSIDPSIYVETAQRLMRGNNETNLDFDVDNELIQKGKLTGARFNSWNSSLALPTSLYSHSTSVYGGYIYVVGGNAGSGSVATVYWAKFNTTTGAIEAPNPGSGACASWCTNTVYNLPAVREGVSTVAYNGYLYVMGGHTSSGGVGSPTNTIYIAKLGLNGEPALWHPTDTNPNNWVYWYTEATNPLSSNRTYHSAVAYNGRMYLIGGYSGSADLTTVQYTDLDPTGLPNAWSTTGMVQLSSGAAARSKHSVQVYNDRIYVIGGANGTTAQTTNYYIKVNSDGTMAGTTWNSTKALTIARATTGGNFSTIWGGYVYVFGGCSVVTSAPCAATSNILNTTEVASINADGTVSDWRPITVTSPPTRMSQGFVGWRGVLYNIGGCSAITASACSTAQSTTYYGVINQDGEASSVRSSEILDPLPAPAGWRCDDSANSYDCNLPPEGDNNGQIGNMAGAAIVNNGFIYYLGGCTEVNAGTSSACFNGASGKTSDNIAYSSIRSDGVLVRVAATACDEGSQQFYGHWCVENTSPRRLPVALAGFSATIFNNTMYVVGGTSGKQWQSNVYRNTPNTDGSLGSWSAAQTFADLGINDTVGTTPTSARGYSYVFTRSNPSSAATYPGNLYILGGCAGVGGAADDGINCQGTPNPVFNSVWKCNIKTDTSLEITDANDCDTANQLQIDAEPGLGGNQGLGVMAGAMYANYIYLVGGQSTNENDRGKVMYAKIDNSNNIVDADGETVTDNIWTTSANEISPARRRGVAFGYNGYLYAIAGYASGTSLNDLLFAKINTSDGSIGAFVTSTVTVEARWDLRVMVNNGYVYTIGGCSDGAPPSSCSTMTGGVQVFQLYNNYSGAPALYSVGANLFSTDRMAHGTAVLNGYIYVAGGCTGLGDCTVASSNTQFAQISSTGAVGAWANTTDSTLPAVLGWGKLVAAGGSLYFVGGQTGSLLGTSYSSDVFWATPSTSTGNIASWATATSSIGEIGGAGAVTRSKMGVAVWNNRIYVVGGYNGSVQSTVWVSPQQNSGGDITGDWVSTTGINVARMGITAITYANNIYVLGGSTDGGTTITGDVQFAKINADGTIPSGSWTYTSSLVDKLMGADGFAYNGFMYLFGGRSSAEICETNTIAAPISANTTIASGNNPTGIGDWFETNEKYVGSRYGAAAVYWEGKAYITGGGCKSSLEYTGANRVVQTTLLIQPQVAKYSRMIDTDTDVFPKDWLMNGLDNSTGAEWYLRYRSMHDLDTSVNPNEDCGTSATMPVMTTWGQETNFGKVELGRVEDYTPKNSSGGNINCARYFYFSTHIDSTQAFGYPEDVTRGPTIYDLTLFFTSDPSKRLLHGKTFTGGEQQPLDTPCHDSDGNLGNNPDVSPNDDACGL